MSGWIKLHRSIQDHFIYDFSEPDKAMAWIDILLSASYQESKVKIKSTLFTVSKGQWLVSQVTLQKRWRLSQNKVKRLLKLLESDGMIKLNTNDLTSVITICNDNDYQNDERPDEQAHGRAGERGTDEQANDIQRNKEIKEGKELKDHVDSDESPAEKPKRERKVFKPPTVEQVDAYMQEINWGSHARAVEFVAHYEANNWTRGKTKMSSWKAAVRVWQAKDSNQPGAANYGTKTNSGNKHEQLERWRQQKSAELAAEAERLEAEINQSGQDGYGSDIP